jgi:acyl carrier protein
VLCEHPGVRQGVVIAREERPGDKQLVAYVVGRDPAPSVAELRQFLQAKLPDYMVPAWFMLLDELPLSPNGKLDRRALPAPSGERTSGAAFVPPETDAQRRIAAVWSEVLGTDKVGIHDNFFDLGGHSLLLVELHSKLREVFGQDISIVDLFRYPTVDALATQLSGRTQGEDQLGLARDRAQKQRTALVQHRQRMQQRRLQPRNTSEHGSS